MKPITFPLKNSDIGSDVLNLHDALLLLIVKGQLQLPSDNLPGLNNEQQALRFGSDAQKAITLFQQQHQRNRTRDVVAPRADNINGFACRET